MAKILYVEDDPAMRRAMRDRLLHEGFRVTLAGSVDDARAELRESTNDPFDLVMCDGTLKTRNDGADFAAELHAQRGGPKVVIISGNEEAYREGIAFLLKGLLTVKQMIEEVRRLLAD